MGEGSANRLLAHKWEGAARPAHNFQPERHFRGPAAAAAGVAVANLALVPSLHLGGVGLGLPRFLQELEALARERKQLRIFFPTQNFLP